jgi:RHS repeat-associated protein
MKKRYLYIILLLICQSALTAHAQLGPPIVFRDGSDMAHAIDVNASGALLFVDTQDNSSFNFSNSLGEASNDIYYTFTIESDLTVDISHCGTLINSYVHLLDAGGFELASNDDNGPLCTGTAASLSVALAPGTYYVLSEGEGSNFGAITTSISWHAGSTGGGPVSSVPGSSIYNAINAWPAALPGTPAPCRGLSFSDLKDNSTSNGFSDHIGQGSNDVYYTFTLSAANTVDISTCGSAIDTYLHLLDDTGAEIAYSDDNGPLCAGTSASIQALLPAGTYFVLSEGNGFTNGNILTSINIPPSTVPAGSSSALAIDMGILAMGTPVTNTYTATDCYEPYGTDAFQIYYKFTLTSTAEVTISNCGSVNSGYFANLMDANGLLIANAVMNGPVCPSGIQASIVQTLDAGVYYVGIPGYLLSDPIVTTISMQTVGSCIPLASAPSADQNYIVTYTPRQPFTDAASLPGKNICEVMETIQYIDGLGRPLQIVQVKGSPTKNDIVQPIAYDQFERESTKFLSYTTSTGAAGSFRPDALTAGKGVYNFYNLTGSGVSGDLQGNGIVTIPEPFAQTAFEPSPLNRVVEQGAPGADWQLGQHTGKTQYTNNDLTDYQARLFEVNIDVNGTRTLTDQGSYVINQLYVTVTKNENWTNEQADNKLNTTEEYKDKNGHVVLKRTFNWKNNVLEVLSTYYVYDDSGNLCYVLPPKAEPDAGLSSAASQTTLDNLCYQYHYDSRNRVTEKKIPGKGWEFLVYNKLDQIIMTQDANQRNKTPQEWTFTKYDALGRAAISGIYAYPASTADNNVSNPDKSEITWLQNYSNVQTTLWEIRDNASSTGYSNLACPQGTVSYLSINYYDDYNFPVSNPYPYVYDNQISGMPLTNSLMTKGLLTATTTIVLNTIGNSVPDMLWTVNYYDDKGRTIQSNQQHYLGGVANYANYDQFNSGYDFTNAVVQAGRNHYTSINPVVKIYNKYVYDHMGRKWQSWSQINGGTNVLLNQIAYNEIGQMKTNSLHSATGFAPFLQDINYSYNERGWLTKSSAGLFEEQLQYNKVDAVTGISPTAQFNGNIASQSWGTASAPNSNSYIYTYDALNRLIEGSSIDGYNEKDIIYDKAGNISALKRYWNNSLIDDLTYSYILTGNPTNQLQSISDAAISTQGLTQGSNWMYGNDINGNMVSDNSKSLAVIYNMLNLPAIATLPGGTINYTYDAGGKKLRKVSAIGSGSLTTEYVNGIQYNGTSIDFIQTESGRVMNVTASPNYEYTLTDHLGNSRVTFDSATGAGAAKQQDDYYPFGMEISRGIVPSLKNEYLYNKKELQEELGQYDYGARFYDPVIARWGTIDLMAENHTDLTPYNYVMNNPLLYGDAMGMDTVHLHQVEIRSDALITKQKPGAIFSKDDDGYSVRSYKPQPGYTPFTYRDMGMAYVNLGMVFFPWGRVAKVGAAGLELIFGEKILQAAAELAGNKLVHIMAVGHAWDKVVGIVAGAAGETEVKAIISKTLQDGVELAYGNTVGVSSKVISYNGQVIQVVTAEIGGRTVVSNAWVITDPVNKWQALKVLSGIK